MPKISGILLNPIGQPIPECTIELKARKTALTVITKTEASLSSDRRGYYSMDVEPGEYSVSLQLEGYSKNRLGCVRIYSDSPNGSLNDFLISEAMYDDLTPEFLKDFQSLSQTAQNAANEAKIHADNAQSAVSSSNIGGIVRQQMRKVIYIDNINGSDDNDGLTLSTPLKTFNKASRLIPAGAAALIYLMSDYVFSPDETIVAFYGANIMIRSQFISNPVTIKFNYYIPPDYPEHYFMNSFQYYYSGSIEFYAINLELPGIPADHQPGKYYPTGASVVKANASNLVAIQLGVRLSNVVVNVPEPERSEWHFVGNASGMTDLMLSGTTLPTAWRDRNKMLFQGRLSNTICCRATINTTTALSTDANVYNEGRVN